jgi:hypothetical protein
MITVVYVVAFNPRKILLINPPMGRGSKSGNTYVWRKSSNCIIALVSCGIKIYSSTTVSQ